MSLSLVTGYGSDEEINRPTNVQPRGHAGASGLGDEDEEVDVTGDAFGINGLTAQRTDGATGGKAIFSGAAPDVMPSIDATSSAHLITRPTDTVMNVNISYEDMSRPLQGPANPYSDRKLERYNTATGLVEDQFISDRDFRTQQKTFHVQGYAANPSNISSLPFVGDVHGAHRANGQTIHELKPSRKQQAELRRKRKGKGKLGEFEDPDEEGAEGEVEAGEGEGDAEGGPKKKVKVQKEYVGPWAGWEDENVGPGVSVGPDEEEIEEAARKSIQKAPIVEKSKKDVGWGEEKSVLHIKSLYDYQGRSYLATPRDVDVDLESEPGSQQSFLPKKAIFTWTGHTKGVSVLRLFPNTGHLLLSGSMDNRIKLWDVYHDGKCLRTFMGHGMAVKDVTFSNDGKRFLSAGYDRQMKLWDTETGQCIKAFSNGKIPYVVKFHPDKQDTFLAGMSDKKIIQYDINSGEITQEYDQHLGPVNTITFIDNNQKFLTSSDDKTLRAWEWDIPVVTKYIADPTMHSMPAVTKHPNGKWLAMQSLDNQILIYGTDCKQNRSKRFAGHTVAGYACQPGFSPDGRFVSSGDGEGNMVFWDWKSTKIVKKFRAHNQVVISHAWLPHETSKVVTASWDGLIKLWD